MLLCATATILAADSWIFRRNGIIPQRISAKWRTGFLLLGESWVSNRSVTSSDGDLPVGLTITRDQSVTPDQIDDAVLEYDATKMY